MIPALMMLSVLWWGHWWIFRNVRSAQPTNPPGAAARRPTGETTALGLQDDLDQYATGSAWTALDERQLIRLLTDSAPGHPPAATAIDTGVADTEHEDTP